MLSRTSRNMGQRTIEESKESYNALMLRFFLTFFEEYNVTAKKEKESAFEIEFEFDNIDDIERFYFEFGTFMKYIKGVMSYYREKDAPAFLTIEAKKTSGISTFKEFREQEPDSEKQEPDARELMPEPTIVADHSKARAKIASLVQFPA